MKEVTDNLFDIKQEAIELTSLDSLLLFLKYDPSVSKQFPAGFNLSEPLNNKTGGILYPKDTELNPNRIDRLLKLKEVNPDYKFTISLAKSNFLINYCREKIKGDFFRLVEAKKRKTEFRKSIGKIEQTMKSYSDDFLNNTDLVFTLYRTRCIDETTSTSGVPVFYNHSINELILAINIVNNSHSNIGIKFKVEDIKNLAYVALLHNIKGIETKHHYIKYKPIERRKLFIEENQNSYKVAESLSMSEEVINTIKLCNNYHKGNRDFIKRAEDTVDYYANIMVVADVMDEKTSGLFEEPVKPWNAADQLYVLAENGQFRKGYVNALCQSLKLDSLFDFYQEIERLTKMCLFKTSARPYPMLGFKSPVIFLCKDKRTNCKAYGANVKSVHVFKANSGLTPGVYGRCNLLSKLLFRFYETNYKQIKEDIILTESEKSKQKKNQR